MWIFGASGHGKVIAEIIEQCGLELSGFIDNDRTKKNILNYTINHEFPDSFLNMIIAVGDNLNRKKIADQCSFANFPLIVHPNSFISKKVQIGDGTVVMSGVSINIDSKLGKHCIINTNASVDHDCILENFVHISPNAAIAGNVYIGEGTHVGIGACVIQGVTIGKWCTIGAGAVIIDDVPNGATIVGNPGKIIKISNYNFYK